MRSSLDLCLAVCANRYERRCLVLLQRVKSCVVAGDQTVTLEHDGS